MAAPDLRSLSALVVELRRRKVFRVSVAYVVVGGAVMSGVNNFFPALQLPGWTVTLTAALVVVGFPITILLAWAFDITAKGLTRTPSDADAESAADAVGDVAPQAPAVAAAAGPIRALAVLPFANLSPDRDDEYFSDGMTEELIGTLSRVDGLRVAARTSAFALKGSPLDVREIGAKLGVQAVLEGSVRRGGNRIRVSAQLVSAVDGLQRWSDTYEYELDDVLRIQEEISHAVVSALRAHGMAVIGAPRAYGAASSGEAYDLYFRGRYAWNRRTPQGLRTAVTCFERAVAIDPQFALAHAGLADAIGLLMDYGLAPPRSALAEATEAAERALALAPDLAEAHASAALVRQCAWNWQGAEAAFRRALALNPGYAAAYHRYALLLAWLGRPDEALLAMRNARELDPLSLVVNAGIAWVHYYARSFVDAIRQCGDVLELDPAFMNAHIVRGLALLATGDAAGAVAALETASRLSEEAPTVLPILGLAYGRAGRSAEAAGVLERVRTQAGRAYVPAYYIAVAALGVGDEQEALRQLENAVGERCIQLVQLRADALWDDLRGQPRLDAVLRGTGLPPLPMTSAGAA